MCVFFSCGEDFATDGRWCYIVLWVIGKPETKWGLVKKRLVGACPSCYSASGISYYREEFLKPPRSPDVFLVKLCCHDRRGLLHGIFLVNSLMLFGIIVLYLSIVMVITRLNLSFLINLGLYTNPYKRRVGYTQTCYILKSIDDKSR